MDVHIFPILLCNSMTMEEIILSDEDKQILLKALFPILAAALVEACVQTFIKVFNDGRYIE